MLCLKLIKYIFPFFFLIIVSLIGFRYVIFTTIINYEKTQFRQNVLKQKQKNTQSIKISNNQLYKDLQGIEWKDGGLEVLMNGIYYEVVSISKNADGYIVNIEEDIIENEAFKTYFNLEETNDELPIDVLTDLELDFFLPSSQFEIFQNKLLITHCTKYLYADIPSVYFCLLKPPCV